MSGVPDSVGSSNYMVNTDKIELNSNSINNSVNSLNSYNTPNGFYYIQDNGYLNGQPFEEISNGTVTAPYYIVGDKPNNDYTRLYTPYLGDGASVFGEMSDANANGDIYTYAKLGPTGASYVNNIVLCFATDNLSDSLDDFVNHDFVGFAHITTPYSSAGQEYYLGHYSSFQYLVLGAFAFGGSDPYNDVMIDDAFAWTIPNEETISVSWSGDGYTTGDYSPLMRGDYQYEQYTSAVVYANPNYGSFDYWRLDGNYAGDASSISVFMDTDHTLQAVFSTTTQDYYVASIDTENSFADCPEGVIGNVNDGAFAGLSNLNGNDVIYCALNNEVWGQVQVYGMMQPNGEYSSIIVYTSSDGVNWDGLNYVGTSSELPDWQVAGTPSNSFSYIALVGNTPYTFFVDSVTVLQGVGRPQM